MNLNCKAKTANKKFPAYIKIFHKYRSGPGINHHPGYLVKISVRKLMDYRCAHIAKKRKKARGIWVRSVEWSRREDGSIRRFFDHSVLLMRRKYVPVKGRVMGLILLDVKKKRIINLFNKVL